MSLQCWTQSYSQKHRGKCWGVKTSLVLFFNYVFMFFSWGCFCTLFAMPLICYLSLHSFSLLGPLVHPLGTYWLPLCNTSTLSVEGVCILWSWPPPLSLQDSVYLVWASPNLEMVYEMRLQLSIWALLGWYYMNKKHFSNFQQSAKWVQITAIAYKETTCRPISKHMNSFACPLRRCRARLGLDIHCLYWKRSMVSELRWYRVL